MSTILYHKGILVTDSGFVVKVGQDYRIFSNDSNKTKLVLSSGKMIALAFTGEFILKNQLINVANFFECILKRDGVINIYDKMIRDTLINVASLNCSELVFLIMEKKTRSVYMIELRDDDKKISFSSYRYDYDDTVGLGTGGLIGCGAINNGMGILEAAEFTVKVDAGSRFPLRYVTMDDLHDGEFSTNDEVTILEFTKAYLEHNHEQ